MHVRRTLCRFFCASVCFLSGFAVADENWPSFRGPNASGIAERSAPPTDWDVSAGRNLLWKTPIAGLAHASPIVWGDRLFVVTAVAEGLDSPLKVGLYGAGDSADDMVPHEWKVLCLDKRSGEVLWERVAARGVPKVKRHTKATHANSTPATDGRVVVACFGSEGLYAFDLDGNPLWSKQLGVLDVGPHDFGDLQWGYASSPILHDGKVYLQCDVKEKPFLLALDAKTGEQVWKVDRDDVPGWCTPAIFESGGSTQLLINGCKHIGGYDAETGREIWRMRGGGGIPVPAPVIAEGLAFFTSNHRPIDEQDRRQPVYAVRVTAARGDVSLPIDKDSSDAIAWAASGVGTYMQTPLVYRGLAYLCKDNGAATCFDAKTGETKWRVRIGTGAEGYTASPVAADGRIYWTSEEGDVHVIAAGDTFERLAKNQIGEICMATPAISGDVLYFRTQKHVIAIGAKR